MRKPLGFQFENYSGTAAFKQEADMGKKKVYFMEVAKEQIDSS